MKWRQIYHNAFNIQFAVISALFNGVVVATINWKYGLLACISASGAQAFSSFFSTGVTARVVQHFSPIKDRIKSYLGGSFVPAMLTLIMSGTAHYLNHTHDILISSIPSVLISFTTSFVTNFITRLGYMRPPNYPAH